MMNSDDSAYLRALISQGEHQELDFKFEISSARKIARTLSAFANTNGGTLLIGVKDNGRITGIRSDEEFYMVEAAASLHCKPALNFDSYQRVSEGHTVLEVYIPPSPEKPVYSRDDKDKWMAFVRVADENILASIVQVKLWKEEKSENGILLEFTRKEKILLSMLDKEHGRSLKQVQSDSGYPRRELIDMLVQLVRFGVVRIFYKDGEARFHSSDDPGLRNPEQ